MYNFVLSQMYGEDSSSQPEFDPHAWTATIGGMETTRTHMHGFGTRVPITVLLTETHSNVATSESACGPINSNATSPAIALGEKMKNLSKNLGKICEEVHEEIKNTMAESMSEFMAHMEIMIMTNALLKLGNAGPSSSNFDKNLHVTTEGQEDAHSEKKSIEGDGGVKSGKKNKKTVTQDNVEKKGDKKDDKKDNVLLQLLRIVRIKGNLSLLINLLVVALLLILGLMTLEVYEKKKLEDRNTLEASKRPEERKVEDEDLESMQPIGKKKKKRTASLNLKKLKKKDNIKEEKARKTLSINEFLKLAEGETPHLRQRQKGDRPYGRRDIERPSSKGNGMRQNGRHDGRRPHGQGNRQRPSSSSKGDEEGPNERFVDERPNHQPDSERPGLLLIHPLLVLALTMSTINFPL
ncbi:Uncharacterized protein TCM_002729 [Theobroma cacao]|uniref:Uncharacterized protein n=1 Tax=Theobroma cacao TaxID=3641 RepID=A0A061DN02_THECC|nr:Uncharacterized protein TCM_002729 [Theobroma cacao]